MISSPFDHRLLRDDDLIVVVGGGAAGMAAAISAARTGTQVALIEKSSCTGGTVTNSLIHTLGGFFDYQGEYLNQGIAVELTEKLSSANSQVEPRQIGKTWTLSVSPETYADVVSRWLTNEANLTVMTETTIDAVQAESGRITAIDISGPFGRDRLSVGQAIDTSGSAALVRMVAPELVYDDPVGAASGLILRLRSVGAKALQFPHSAKLLRGIRKATTDGSLPKECANVWLDRGVAEDEVYVKLSVPLTSRLLATNSRQDLLRRVDLAQAQLVEFLQSYPEFTNASLDRVGELGIRDGGRIKGEYCLTKEDVWQGRTFDDGVCRCSWPIEYWHPEKGVTLEYLPDGSSYEIPLRSLKVQYTENLWAAGKCLSADHLAQASARVVGSCWSMGEAVGQAAAKKCLVAKS